MDESLNFPKSWTFKLKSLNFQYAYQILAISSLKSQFIIVFP